MFAIRRFTPAVALCLALGGSAVAAPPAAAETVYVYKLSVKTDLSHERVGHDDSLEGITWHRETQLRSILEQQALQIEFTDDRSKLPAPVPVATTAVTDTDLADTITLTADGAPQFSSCVNDGEGVASPGQLSFAAASTAWEGGGFALHYQPFTSFQVFASCSGFSSAKGIFDFSDDTPPAKTTWPYTSIGSDTIHGDFFGKAPCPVGAQTEPTVSCVSAWHGEYTFELVRKYERPSTGAPSSASTTPSTPEHPPVTSPVGTPASGGPAKPGKPAGPRPNTATVDRSLKRGKVDVACPAGCTGKISAYAVARKRRGFSARPAAFAARSRAVGTATLRSTSDGRAGGTVRFGKAAQRILRRSGAIEYRVRITPAGGRNARTERILVQLPGQS